MFFISLYSTNHEFHGKKNIIKNKGNSGMTVEYNI